MGRIEAYVMSIKFSKQEMSEMENIINGFFEKQKKILSVPVDVFQIATDIGFDVRGANFKNDLDGLIIVDENVEKIEPFTTNKVIAYNCKSNIHHKKFIVGHELAHYIEDKHKNEGTKIVLAARDHTEPYSDDIEEQRKDYISAAILMPKTALLKEYPKEKMDKIKQTEDFYKEIADKYKVSLIMAKRRVEEIYG